MDDRARDSIPKRAGTSKSNGLDLAVGLVLTIP
jgi:hypothetical protein